MRFTVRIESSFVPSPIAEGVLNDAGIPTISKGAVPEELLESFQRHLSGFYHGVGIYFGNVGGTDYRIDFIYVN